MKKLRTLLLAGVLALGLGCEKDSEQFVAPNTADVRGTWYEHGSSGGWYGPNNEWGFGWFYLEQSGTNISGKWEHELYDKGKVYDDLTNVRGTVQNDHLIVRLDSESSYEPLVDVRVQGNNAGRLERVSSESVRRATPWNPDGEGEPRQ